MTVFPGFMLIDWIDTNSYDLFAEGHEAIRWWPSAFTSP